MLIRDGGRGRARAHPQRTHAHTALQILNKGFYELGLAWEPRSGMLSGRTHGSGAAVRSRTELRLKNSKFKNNSDKWSNIPQRGAVHVCCLSFRSGPVRSGLFVCGVYPPHGHCLLLLFSFRLLLLLLLLFFFSSFSPPLCLALQTVKLSTTLSVAFPLRAFKIKSQRNTQLLMRVSNTLHE